jgi:hypothetical protein
MGGVDKIIEGTVGRVVASTAFAGLYAVVEDAYYTRRGRTAPTRWGIDPSTRQSVRVPFTRARHVLGIGVIGSLTVGTLCLTYSAIAHA